MTWEQDQRKLEVLRERAKSSLQRRSVGLGDQRDYFERMAADMNNSKKDRALWQRLADELSGRLNDRATGQDQQEALPFDE